MLDGIVKQSDWVDMGQPRNLQCPVAVGRQGSERRFFHDAIGSPFPKGSYRAKGNRSAEGKGQRKFAPNASYVRIRAFCCKGKGAREINPTANNLHPKYLV